jgi:hypothetical protein
MNRPIPPIYKSGIWPAHNEALRVATRCRPDLPCFLIDPDVYLPPDAPFGTAMRAGVPVVATIIRAVDGVLAKR